MGNLTPAEASELRKLTSGRLGCADRLDTAPTPIIEARRGPSSKRRPQRGVKCAGRVKSARLDLIARSWPKPVGFVVSRRTAARVTRGAISLAARSISR